MPSMSFSANVIASFSHPRFHKSSFADVGKCSEYTPDAVYNTVSLVLQKVWIMTCDHNHVFLVLQLVQHDA